MLWTRGTYTVGVHGTQPDDLYGVKSFEDLTEEEFQDNRGLPEISFPDLQNLLNVRINPLEDDGMGGSVLFTRAKELLIS